MNVGRPTDACFKRKADLDAHSLGLGEALSTASERNLSTEL
jgi:hypothetical protein